MTTVIPRILINQTNTSNYTKIEVFEASAVIV